MSLPERPRFYKLLTGLLVVLFCSAVYLFAWPQPNIFYAGVVVFHVAVGLLTTIVLAVTLWRRLRQETAIARLGEPPRLALVDGLPVGGLTCPHLAVIDGDACCASDRTFP